MAVSIRDVAERSGVSIPIVSKLLDEYGDRDGEIRRRVMQAARELGYPLDGPRRRTNNLGVLFVDESYSGLTHPFFASMLNAFKASVEANGFDLTFINHNIGQEGMTYLQHCRLRGVDGVCLACVDFDAPEVGELLSSEIPCVTIDHVWPNQPCVISDNRNGMRMLVDYAVSLGHRRIAFIHGQRNSDVTEARVSEYLNTMRLHKLEVPEGYLVEGKYDDTDVIRRLVARMLELPQRPTCILLPDDASYLGAQEAIHAHELRIPADLSVAGYDGIKLTQSLRPQLTTIHQNSVEMGRTAAEQLIRHLEDPDAPFAPVRIPVSLIKGATMGWCNAW